MKLRQKIFIIFLVVLPLIAMFAGAIYYVIKVQDSVWNQAAKDALEVTTQGSHAFDVNLRKNLEMMQGVVDDLSRYESGQTKEIVEALTLSDGSDFEYRWIDLKQGKSYSHRHSTGKKLGEEELEEYKNLGEKGVQDPYIDSELGIEVIAYYQRCTLADGREGLIQKSRALSLVVDEFSLSFYNNSGFSYVINKKGDVLIRPAHQNSNQSMQNIIDIMAEEGNSEESTNDFKTAIAANQKGVTNFYYEDIEYVCAYVPVNAVEDWYFIAIIPDSVMSEHSNQVLKTSYFLAFIMITAIMVLCIIFALLYINHRNVQRKDTEIQYREQLFSILAKNTDDVFLMMDTDQMQTEYISPNVERVLGVSQEEARENPKLLRDANYIDGNIIGEKQLYAVGPNNSVTLETERIQRKNGDRHWFNETVYRARVDNTEKFIIIISDRTKERKSREALEEALKMAHVANEAKSAFLSNMSHDIRTPMNAIVGLCTLLFREAENPERVRDYTKQLTASSEHLLSLINDVLDMSKIESGTTTLNISEINLADIISELNMIIMPQAKAKNQDFTIQVSSIENEHLLGDKVRINQILINILSNAVKYTQPGGQIEMVVKERPQRTKNISELRIVIQDNGQGMSEEYLETIFDPFTREENGNTDRIQGTGLGMTITKNLVELMGGTIHVESALGKGTTFTVDLSLSIPEQHVDPKFWENHGVSRTLVVDDEVEICANILKAMSGTGVDMQYAVDGQTAIEMVVTANRGGRDFDLVLLDWKMPGMSGIETAKGIRKAVSKDIPIMILTAYDWADIEEEAKEAGINAFLLKPFFLTNFKETIEKLNNEGRDSALFQEDEDVLAGRHFLVAEDNLVNAQIVKKLLPIVGATCEIAENGEVAVKMFEESKPGHFDMILMDIQMPVMDGYEATRAIRAGSHPRARTIPIVAMTANAFAQDVQMATEAGMDYHIAKPINLKYLQKVIREILDEREKDS